MAYGVLGPHGTFSEEAALRYWGREVKLQAARDIPQLFAMVEKKEIDAALVPIDNTRAGSIEPTMESLFRTQVAIAGEISLPIEQQLVSTSKYRLDELELLISQPAALLQCKEFIQEHLPWIRTEIAVSTTRAAQLLGSEKRRAAAIANQQTARHYGLEILYPNISGRDNITRFVHIVPRDMAVRGDKCSLIFSLPDRPGALYQALGVLFRRGININKIESRPSPEQMNRFWFYCEVSLVDHEEEITEVLGELDLYSHDLKYLGSYPSGGVMTGWRALSC